MAKTMPTRIKTVGIVIVEDGQERVEKIEVKKVALGKWKGLTDTIKKLVEIIPEILKQKGVEDPEKYFEQMEIKDLMLLIPDMLQIATDELINILALGAGLTKEYIEENVGLDEAVDLLEAVIEVNNLVKVVEKGKNVISLWGGKKVRQRK